MKKNDKIQKQINTLIAKKNAQKALDYINVEQEKDRQYREHLKAEQEKVRQYREKLQAVREEEDPEEPEEPLFIDDEISSREKAGCLCLSIAVLIVIVLFLISTINLLFY